jgi:methionine--tRNA ligase beta chain
MDTITIDDFAKIDFRVGKVVEALEVPESNKLLRLKVFFGDLGERIIFSAIKKWYEPSDLEKKSFVFVFNLESRKMMGEESQGMIVAAETEDGADCVLLIPEKEIAPGTKVH